MLQYYYALCYPDAFFVIMHLKATRVSKVIIVDANDNAPEFVDNVLAASVSEVR